MILVFDELCAFGSFLSCLIVKLLISVSRRKGVLWCKILSCKAD